MRFIEGRPGLEYRGSMGSRAQAIVVKTLALVMGGVVLASVFVLSLILFAVACAVIAVGGGYLWWKTRELRKQMRAQMRESNTQRANGAFAKNVIEGEVISRGQSPGDSKGP